MVSSTTIKQIAPTWINGTPYTWGGSSKNGNDCSGFVCGVYKEAQAPFPARTTAEGLRQQCIPVNKSEAIYGDLVFFENTYVDDTDTPGPDGKIATHIGFVTDSPDIMLDSHEQVTGAVGYTDITTSYWHPKLIEYRRPPQLEARSVPSPQPDWEAEKSFVGDILSPEGEVQHALQEILDGLNGWDTASTEQQVQNLINRLNTLWEQYNA